MAFIRFFTISTISILAFGALVYGLSSLWSWKHKPVESRAQIAVMHLSKDGKEASAEQVREAAKEGDLRSLKLLGIAGMNFNEPDELKRSALHLAIENEQWSALGLLEKYGGDILHKDSEGMTPVSKLIKKGRVDLADEYIEKGASIQYTTADKTPVLMNYLRERDFEAFDYLLENDADPNACDAQGKSLLQLALELGMSDRVIQLITAGASSEQLQLDGSPAIAALAVNQEKYDIRSHQLSNLVTGLILSGADPEAIEPSSQLRPILLAIRDANQPMFDALLANQVDTTDCVWQAIFYERVEILESLFRSGISVDEPGMNGDTPLVALVRSGENLSLIEKLLDYGADPDQLTKEGQRLLFMAIVENRTEAAMVLINHENSADVNLPMTSPVSDSFRSLYGKKGLLDWYCRKVKKITPVVLGVLCEDVALVERMIKLGAKKNIRTSAKTYPIHIAAQTGNVHMMQLIIGVPYQDHLQKRKFIIDLSEQQVYFYKDGKLIKKSRRSTGKRGYRTRTGLFVISDKQRHKISNIYGSSMPYFQRFSCSDFGFHYGNTGSRYASHGCIRLPMSTAKHFFYNAKRGDRVLIRP